MALLSLALILEFVGLVCQVFFSPLVSCIFPPPSGLLYTHERRGVLLKFSELHRAATLAKCVKKDLVQMQNSVKRDLVSAKAGAHPVLQPSLNEILPCGV